MTATLLCKHSNTTPQPGTLLSSEQQLMTYFVIGNYNKNQIYLCGCGMLFNHSNSLQPASLCRLLIKSAEASPNICKQQSH